MGDGVTAIFFPHGGHPGQAENGELNQIIMLRTGIFRISFDLDVFSKSVITFCFICNYYGIIILGGMSCSIANVPTVQ